MRRYHSLFILLALSLCSCYRNKPEEAAKEYCDCLQKQYDNNINEKDAWGNCDSIMATRYKEFYTYYFDKKAGSPEWDSAAIFHNEVTRLRLRYCCKLIGNCDTANTNYTDSLQ
jgi:hypothetical protein